MLNTETKTIAKNQVDGQMDIAVRLYENTLYGTTHGKGLYRMAVFNGSIDIKEPAIKYVIDLCSYDDWSNTAKTNEHMVVLEAVTDVKDKLYSWIYRYDCVNKIKTAVGGCCTLDLQTSQVEVLLCDDAMDIAQRCVIDAKPCKQASFGKKSPQLLAANYDLGAR